MSDESLAIFRAQLAALLRELEASGADLAAIHAQLSETIVAKLRAMPANANASTEQLQLMFEAEIAKTLPRRASIIRTNIEAGASKGRKAARKTIRVAFGDAVQDKQVRATAGALKQAGERIAGRVTADNVGLTKRLRGVDKEIAQQMAREVHGAIVQRRGVLGAAKRIEAIDPRDVRLPGYLADLEAAARSGKLDEVKRLSKQYAGKLAKLGELQADGTRIASKYSLKSATKKFVSAVEKAGAKGLDKAVATYVKEKAAFRAAVISKHETVSAFADSYVEQAKKKRGVVAFRWSVSPTAHHIPDECDLYARSNNHSMGPGVYPADKLPHRHTSCRCAVSAVTDRRTFERSDAEAGKFPDDMRDHKSPDAIGWLKQNDAAAARILGPTRYQLMHQGVDVLDANGAPRLVRDLLHGARQHAAE